MAMENGERIQAENSAKQLRLVRLQSSPDKMKEKETEDYKTMSPMASKFKTCNGQYHLMQSINDLEKVFQQTEERATCAREAADSKYEATIKSLSQQLDDATALSISLVRKLEDTQSSHAEQGKAAESLSKRLDGICKGAVNEQLSSQEKLRSKQDELRSKRICAQNQRRWFPWRMPWLEYESIVDERNTTNTQLRQQTELAKAMVNRDEHDSLISKLQSQHSELEVVIGTWIKSSPLSPKKDHDAAVEDLKTRIGNLEKDISIKDKKLQHQSHKIKSMITQDVHDQVLAKMEDIVPRSQLYDITAAMKSMLSWTEPNMLLEENSKIDEQISYIISKQLLDESVLKCKTLGDAPTSKGHEISTMTPNVNNGSSTRKLNEFQAALVAKVKEIYTITLTAKYESTRTAVKKLGKALSTKKGEVKTMVSRALYDELISSRRSFQKELGTSTDKLVQMISKDAHQAMVDERGRVKDDFSQHHNVSEQLEAEYEKKRDELFAE
ncbi:hypothetical protein BS50DRAFT_631295 [Corynespora cassiicola Philippines]|uniref:Uncharacterized protein n=1 Tax=Corynespora cassiicola Philippines TaxID=1448308 RepID=A0A2T2P0W2_CORCC|nr:hypothetical protein BS50DRAFT_631295 [Corynespora cassiicola Philippines]